MSHLAEDDQITQYKIGQYIEALLFLKIFYFPDQMKFPLHLSYKPTKFGLPVG